MNINNIRTENLFTVNNNNNKSNNKLSIGNKGQIVEGIITKVSQMISIDFNGNEIQFPKNSISNAIEGETRKFEILDISKESITLKEVGNKSVATNTCTSVNFAQSFNVIQGGYLIEQNMGDEKSQERMEKISSTITGRDYDDLENEGISVNKKNIEGLSKAIDRIKSNRDNLEESINSQIEKFKKQKYDIIKQSIKNISSDLTNTIIDKLDNSNLPVTDNNILKIANSMQLILSETKMTDKSIIYLLKNEQQPTIKNIYKANYSGQFLKETKLSENTWNELLGQVSDIIEKSNIEVNEESLNIARKLIENDIPLTENIIKDYNSMKIIKDNLNQETVLDSIIDAMKENINSENANLDNSIKYTIQNIIDDLENITGNTIEKAVIISKSQDIDLSINLLTQIQNNSEYFQQTKEIELPKDFDISVITAKRQLEEIRLKMTLEAGTKLLKNGIEIQVDDIEKVVEGLRKIEDEYYNSMLKEANIEETKENRQILSETIQKASELKYMPSYILGMSFKNRNSETISEIYDDGKELKAKFDEANERYETLGTQPRSDLGDSIQLAFKHIDEMLQNMEIEDTLANQRAVRILGYNSMDITEENINMIKEYDALVNSVIENLTPSITLNLIKNNINPLNIPMSELNEKVTEIKYSFGISDEEKYSTYLWKLEKNKSITDEERKSYIGIYRLLNNIQKTDGAALGSVINANQELTLANLLTAVRTIKSNGIDKKVDDNTGTLEDINFTVNSITEQVNTAFHYENSIIDNIINNITPDKLKDLDKDKQILNTNIEKLKEQLQNLEENVDLKSEYLDEQVKEINDLTKYSENAISFLSEFNIENTIENLKSTLYFTKGTGSLYKKLISEANVKDEDINEINKEAKKFLDVLDDKESLLEQYKSYDNTIREILNKSYEDNTLSSNDIKTLKYISNGFELSYNLANRESYEIPIMTNSGLANMNVTFINKSENNGTVNIKISSENYGNIEANFKVKDNAIVGFISCESKNTHDEFMKKNSEFINNIKEDLDISVSRIDYCIDSNVNKTYKSLNEQNDFQINTKQLYSIAKIFVQKML